MNRLDLVSHRTPPLRCRSRAVLRGVRAAGVPAVESCAAGFATVALTTGVGFEVDERGPVEEPGEDFSVLSSTYPFGVEGKC